MKIVLLGYMGCGKSLIAKLLSDKLNFNFYDLDDFIEEKEGLKINQIFEKFGVIKFRNFERKYLDKILNKDEDLVLALGGGTPCYGDNMKIIKNKTISIFLNTKLNELCTRLSKEKENRPLIKDIPNDQLKEFIAKHLFERIPFYEMSHYKIDATSKTPDQLVTQIQGLI